MRGRALAGRAWGSGSGTALAALALLNLVWGGSLPATKVGLEELGPFTLAAARLVIASALFLPWLVGAAGQRLRPGYVGRVAALGVLGFTGTQVLQAVGASGTSAAAASVLASTGPLWMALLAPLVLGERPRAVALLGLALALVGVTLVADPWATDGGGLISQAVVLLSGAAFALYSLLGKATDRTQSPLVFVGISCVGGALAALPLAALELALGGPARPGPLAWGMALYLGAVVTFAGFVVWFWGLRRVTAARAAPMLFLQPLSGLLLSGLALGEALPSAFLLGTALVLAGIYLAARP